MSFKPIVLWKSKPVLTSDDSCTSILQYELPPPPSAAHPPYKHSDVLSPLSYVPPLRYFCLKALVEYPEQVHVLGPARLRYQPPSSRNDFDILQALIPTYRPFSPNHPDFDLRQVDPRLWAVLAQVYYNLPASFREYTLPLSDIYLPLLQAIPNTQHFSLVTVLSLPRCKELTDDTVIELRHLHALAALDASVTALGSFGVQRLAKGLVWTEGDEDQPPERRGPWGLRVLYLKDCINIDDKVFHWLARFPLLSVIDLRGTVCRPWQHTSLPFKPSSNTSLYDPSRLSGVLSLLSSATHKPRTLFSHGASYVLNVDSRQHRENYVPAFRLPICTSVGGKMDHRLLDGSAGEDRSGRDSDEEGSLSEHEEEQPPGPYDLSEDTFGVGLVPRRVRLEPDPDAWMDEVAEHEGEEYTSQRQLAKFYAPPPPPPRRRSPLNLPRGRAVDHLTLFRTPPPWSTLPSSPTKPKPAKSRSMPTSVFSSSSTAHTLPAVHSPLRRKSNEGVAPADQARRRMLAITSMQNMFSLVQKRAGYSTKGVSRISDASASEAKAKAHTNGNPFARSSQAGSAANKTLLVPPTETSPPQSEHLEAGVPETKVVVGGTTLPGEGRAPANATVKRSRAVEETKPPDPPRPAKKLRPISSLPVPEWPMSNMKPLSAHQPRQLPVPKAQKQTTLNVSREPAAKLHTRNSTAERRLSAPATVTRRLAMVQDKRDGTVDKPKSPTKSNSSKSSKSKGNEARRSSGGQNFDWKGWSGV